MSFSSTVVLSSTSELFERQKINYLHAGRMEVTPPEISTSTEVSMTTRISIRASLASASAVVERGSLNALASGSSQYHRLIAASYNFLNFSCFF